MTYFEKLNHGDTINVNQFDDNYFDALYAVIKEYNNLTINLSNQSLAFVLTRDTHWQKIYLAIKKSQRLTINLSGNNLNNLNKECWTQLCLAIKESENLIIDLSNNQLYFLDEEYWQQLSQAIQNSKQLTLILSDSIALLENKAQLKKRWELFCQAIRYSEKLTFDLSGNKLHLLDQEHWALLCQAIRYSMQLTINLSSNGLNRLDAKRRMELCDAIQHSQQLTINLSDNHLDNNFIQTIKRSICQSTVRSVITNSKIDEDLKFIIHDRKDSALRSLALLRSPNKLPYELVNVIGEMAGYPVNVETVNTTLELSRIRKAVGSVILSRNISFMVDQAKKKGLIEMTRRKILDNFIYLVTYSHANRKIPVAIAHAKFEMLVEFHGIKLNKVLAKKEDEETHLAIYKTFLAYTVNKSNLKFTYHDDEKDNAAIVKFIKEAEHFARIKVKLLKVISDEIKSVAMKTSKEDKAKTQALNIVLTQLNKANTLKQLQKLTAKILKNKICMQVSHSWWLFSTPKPLFKEKLMAIHAGVVNNSFQVRL